MAKNSTKITGVTTVLRQNVSNHPKARLVLYITTLFLLTVFGAYFLFSKHSELPVKYTTQYKPAIKVIAVGDIACSSASMKQVSVTNSNECKHQELLQRITNSKPSAVLLLGDLQYDKGDANDFKSVFLPAWLQTGLVGYSVAGNHEYGVTNAQDYFSVLDGSSIATGIQGKGYYKVSLGSWDVYALNSNCEYIGGCGQDSDQYKWLKQELENSTAKCSLAMWHHPIFTSGKYSKDLSSMNRMRTIWELISDKGVDVVLNGHDHMYERFVNKEYDNPTGKSVPREFVVGTGGKSLYELSPIKMVGSEYSTSTYGYLSLNLASLSYGWDFVSIEGKILDSGKQACY